MSEDRNENSGETMLMDAFAKAKDSITSKETEIVDEDSDNLDLDNEDNEKIEQLNGKKPSGYVKIDDPDIQQRFNDIWKQTRASDEANKKLRDHADQLQRALESAVDKLEKIESKQAKNDYDKAISTLYSQMREARELGDDTLAASLEDQILDVKLEKREAERAKKAEPKRENKQVQQQEEAQYYTNAELDYVNNLADEKDDDGNLMRPWLDQSHKDYEKAVKLGSLIALEHTRETGQIAPISKVMERLDKEMSKSHSKSNGSANVLSGRNLTNNEKNNTIRLSDQERFIMDRLNIKRLGIDEKTYAKRSGLINKAMRVSADDF